jgi:microcystin-dependent protein
MATTRLGLLTVVTGDPVSAIREAITANAGTLDDAVLFQQGVIASRPTSTAGSPGVSGREYRSTDETPKMLYKDTGTGWEAGLPVGAILPWPGASAPGGFLMCQGQAVSRSTYPVLFAICGTAYGAGDGSTTFNLPDGSGGRMFIGAGTSALGTTFTRGVKGGEEKHALTEAENGPHAHTLTVPRATTSGQADGPSTYYDLSTAGADDTKTTSTSGSGTPHNIMQLHQVVGGFIIKAA